jgi:hypothetical protein
VKEIQCHQVVVPGGKNLWDWLQLLIIPAVLAIGGYAFTYTTSRNDREATERRTQAEREIAADNQEEASLKEYFEKISELLLHENLRRSDSDAEETWPDDSEHMCAVSVAINVLVGYVSCLGITLLPHTRSLTLHENACPGKRSSTG